MHTKMKKYRANLQKEKTSRSICCQGMRILSLLLMFMLIEQRKDMPDVECSSLNKEKCFFREEEIIA